MLRDPVTTINCLRQGLDWDSCAYPGSMIIFTCYGLALLTRVVPGALLSSQDVAAGRSKMVTSTHISAACRGCIDMMRRHKIHTKLVCTLHNRFGPSCPGQHFRQSPPNLVILISLRLHKQRAEMTGQHHLVTTSVVFTAQHSPTT